MRAVPADFRAREGNLEAELRLHLAADGLELFAEKFLDAPAAQADDVRVLLFQAGFVVMLFTFEVGQIELIHQAALLEQFQRAVDRHPVELGIFFLGHLIQRVGVQMQAGVVDQVEQQAALAGQANAALA